VDIQKNLISPRIGDLASTKPMPTTGNLLTFPCICHRLYGSRGRVARD